MRKSLAGIVLLASAALAQVSASLPAYTVGVGGLWNRGAQYRYNLDISFAVHIPNTPLLWWSDISSPLHKGTNGQPVQSTILTGVAYVPVCSTESNGWTICMVLIGEGGFSIAQAQVASLTSVSPELNGSIGVAFRHGSLFVMPFCKVLATTATVNTPLSSVVQPGLHLGYSFK